VAVALDTSPEALERMRANLELLGDPVEFARRYVRSRGWHLRARDFDDVLAVAVDQCVKAGLSWIDSGTGVAFTTWCWRYMDREVWRFLGRDARWSAELDAVDTEVVDRRWSYRTGTEAYAQVEDRAVIVDLVTRARLSEVQRLALVQYALHGGADGPPPRGHAPMGNLGGGNSQFRGARHHLRIAARTRGWRRDDEWTRARRLLE
jgi:hypothetical protein